MTCHSSSKLANKSTSTEYVRHHLGVPILERKTRKGPKPGQGNRRHATPGSIMTTIYERMRPSGFIYSSNGVSIGGIMGQGDLQGESEGPTF